MTASVGWKLRTAQALAKGLTMYCFGSARMQQTFAVLRKGKTMTDYIKRYDALGLAYNIFKKGGSASNVYFGLKQLKVADVAPVRHGRWIEQGLSPYEGTRRCSICESSYDIKEQFNYCPNCGAKMDEVKDDE